MKKRKPYRHKLNMLEPGLVLCKCLGALLLAGAVLQLPGWRLAARLCFLAAGLLFLLLLVLLAIEQHQDRQLYLAAKEEDPEIP